jgi:hypothetical protein
MTDRLRNQRSRTMIGTSGSPLPDSIELLNAFNLVDANPIEPNSIKLLSTVYNECIQC